MMGRNISSRVAELRECCKGLSDAQKLALANELVRHVSDAHCVLQLRGLATIAAETANEIARRAYIRRAG